MTERMEHQEFDRLLGSGSGFGEGELARLARLARALERNRPVLAGTSPAFREGLRTRLLQEARTGVVIPLSVGARVRASVAARNARLRRSFRTVVATAAAAAMLLVSGSAFALTAGSIPGQAGYPMMLLRERLQLAATFGNVAKAHKELDFARKRFTEVQALKDAGIESTPLYVGALRNMDLKTADATARLLREFRRTGDASVLQPLVQFSLAQREGLESIFDQLPPGARPAARSSLELVTAVQNRVSDVLGGCPCPDDVFTPAGSTVTGGPVACVCAAPRTDSTGVPKSSPPAGSPTETTPKGDGDSDGVNPPPPAPGVLPDLPAGIDDTVNPVIDSLLGTVGASPTPLPSLSLVP